MVDTKVKHFLILIFGTTVVLIIANVKKDNTPVRQSAVNATNNDSKALKTILYWNNFFTEKHFSLGIESSIFTDDTSCSVSCKVHDMADGLPDTPYYMFDAVLFHANGEPLQTVLQDIPPIRSKHQRYVFVLKESPSSHVYDFAPYSNFFNWTMTYRRDSDIFWPYGWIGAQVPISMSRPPKEPFIYQEQNVNNLTAPTSLYGKSKLVAWLVSNCRTSSMREEIANKLATFVPVDVYGDCGPLKSCSRESDSSKCLAHIERDYKFYLSFENSLCEDYVTEKLFRIMKYDLVPIVYGGANYKNIAPPMSYIDVHDYSSIEQLANYLTFLDNNLEEYRKYFWWKTRYSVFTGSKHVLCQICEKLNNPQEPSKVYSDMQSWWYKPNVCQSLNYSLL